MFVLYSIRVKMSDKEYQKNYYLKRKDALKEIYEANKEQILANRKARYEAKKEQLQTYQREYARKKRAALKAQAEVKTEV